MSKSVGVRQNFSPSEGHLYDSQIDLVRDRIEAAQTNRAGLRQREDQASHVHMRNQSVLTLSVTRSMPERNVTAIVLDKRHLPHMPKHVTFRLSLRSITAPQRPTHLLPASLLHPALPCHRLTTIQPQCRILSMPFYRHCSM